MIHELWVHKEVFSRAGPTGFPSFGLREDDCGTVIDGIERNRFMGVLQKLNFGVAGAGARGPSLARDLDAVDSVRVHAICDTDPELLDRATRLLGASESYLDYEAMLAESDIDAVIITTPMPHHAPQAIAALRKGIHVLSEVTAGVSIEECRQLVQVCRESSATYMMAENYTYMRPNQIVREMVRLGLFGTPYYAEGEYLHELKRRNEITKWRRTWQTGVNGVTYGTHSLGPILQWMPGDRVATVCCAGSGHHYQDPRGDEYEDEESSVMLCKMRSGGLVKIRVDMLSDRPHAMTNYQLQGTDGCYESARAPGERDRIWLRSRSKAVRGRPPNWMDLEELAEEFTPDSWRVHEERAGKSGHGGGDLLEMIDFVAALRKGVEPAIGIHEAMDMTLPGLVSQQSMAEGGRWLDVPDSREW